MTKKFLQKWFGQYYLGLPFVIGIIIFLFYMFS